MVVKLTSLAANRILLSRVAHLIFFFDPFIPFFVYVLLTIEFLRLKKAGFIFDHKVRITRLSRLYYRVNVRLVLNLRGIGDVLSSQFVDAVEQTLHGDSLGRQ